MAQIDVFEFTKPSDLLNCLAEMLRLHRAEPLNPTVAALTAVVSWSITDWVWVHCGEQLGAVDKEDFQRQVRKDLPHFSLLQGLCNAFKHGGAIDHPTRLRAAGRMDGVFDDGVFEQGVFEETHLFLEDNEGNHVECMMAFEEAHAFWIKLFKNNNIA